VAEPGQEDGERRVPDQFVQERRLEGGEMQVLRRDAARYPVGVGNLQAPGQCRRAAEQLFVEVVPDPADRLRDEQPGRYRVGERSGR
jgi:hypothetical protein